jgi:hypothetical protein
MDAEDLARLCQLLDSYGRAKFGDKWWPELPHGVLPDLEAADLVALLTRQD